MRSDFDPLHETILSHFIGELFEQSFLDVRQVAREIIQRNSHFPPRSRYRLEYFKRYEIKEGGDEPRVDLPSREIAHQVIEILGGSGLASEVGTFNDKIGDVEEAPAAFAPKVYSRALLPDPAGRGAPRSYIQRRAKCSTVRQIFSLPPEIVVAVKAAARELGVSASLLAASVLEESNPVKKHLQNDS